MRYFPRRSFMAIGVLGLGSAVAATIPLADRTVVRRSPEPGRRDYTHRATYDWAHQTFKDRQRTQSPSQANDSGELAWGEAYVMQSYLTMYRATGDVRYLDLCAEAVDRIVGLRDRERGVTDYRARSGPVWSASGRYTTSWADLVDPNGRSLVRVRSALSDDRALRIHVQAKAGRRFDLAVSSPDSVEEKHAGLSLDAADPRYIIGALIKRSPTPTLLTAIDLRVARTAQVVRTSTTTMRRFRYAFAVHTGMIAAQLLDFRREATQQAALVKRYQDIADRSLEVAQEAVHSHDPDWRTAEAQPVLGGYLFPHGAPVANDGTHLPHNHNLAMAQAQAQLFVQTGASEYRERLQTILRTFEFDMSPGPVPTWPYYWSRSHAYEGYGPADYISSYTPRQSGYRAREDTSHGALDIEAITTCHRLGLSQDRARMERLATTFMMRVARRSGDGALTTADSLDPAARLGTHDLAAPRWIGLSPWNRSVYNFAADLYQAKQPQPTHGQILTSIANLVAYR